jgi:addiction module HigA family antidote
MSRNRLLRGLRPMHPGEMLREDVLPALGKSKAEIARISWQTLYDIIAEKQPVTPGMALRLGKLCGNGPDLWINLQRAYDLVIAERELAVEIKNIPTLTAARETSRAGAQGLPRRAHPSTHEMVRWFGLRKRRGLHLMRQISCDKFHDYLFRIAPHDCTNTISFQSRIEIK